MSGPVLSATFAHASSKLPLFQQLAETIAQDIRRGRLRPGQRLPGTRSLAASSAVHRNTVVAAYTELERQGLVETRPASGTFVSRELPERKPRKLGIPPAAQRVRLELTPLLGRSPFVPEPRGMLALVGGLPDLRELPSASLARAYRHTLRRSSAQLDYASEYGDEQLRVQIAHLLRTTRGLAVDRDAVLITRGSQMAIYLAARALARPRTVIAVEALGYAPAWEAMRLAGAELVPLPVDSGGLSVEHLRALSSRREVAAVYVTPHHQYPTTVTMTAPRRLALLELARARRIAILEDDYDHEVHFAGRPVLPLAGADDAGVVVYVGTLSKVLAPGLRIGYAVAQRPLIEHMARTRVFLDRQGDHAVERALASLIEDGELAAHVRRMRRHYQERRAVLLEGLRSRFSDVLAFREPSGGLAVWARVQRGISVEAWGKRAFELGVYVQTARRFCFDGRARPYLRLGYARLNPTELHLALERLRRALPVR